MLKKQKVSGGYDEVKQKVEKIKKDAKEKGFDLSNSCFAFIFKTALKKGTIDIQIKLVTLPTDRKVKIFNF